VRYLLRERQEILGPYEEDEVRELLFLERIEPDTLAQEEDGAGWRPVSELLRDAAAHPTKRAPKHALERGTPTHDPDNPYRPPAPEPAAPAPGAGPPPPMPFATRGIQLLFIAASGLVLWVRGTNDWLGLGYGSVLALSAVGLSFRSNVARGAALLLVVLIAASMILRAVQEARSAPLSGLVLTLPLAWYGLLGQSARAFFRKR